MAAMMAPVSSKLQSLMVMAARMTASCHSSRQGLLADPVLPVMARLVQKLGRGRRRQARERFIGTKNEMYRSLEEKWRFFEDVGWRRVRRQPHGDVGANEADVIAALRDVGLAGAVV